jgi:hypothetical protein
MSEPSKGEEKTMAYGTEIQEIMGRGYGDVGAPWRIAEERKSVGIGEYMLLVHADWLSGLVERSGRAYTPTSLDFQLLSTLEWLADGRN